MDKLVIAMYRLRPIQKWCNDYSKLTLTRHFSLKIAVDIMHINLWCCCKQGLIHHNIPPLPHHTFLESRNPEYSNDTNLNLLCLLLQMHEEGKQDIFDKMVKKTAKILDLNEPLTTWELSNALKCDYTYPFQD